MSIMGPTGFKGTGSSTEAHADDRLSQSSWRLRDVVDSPVVPVKDSINSAQALVVALLLAPIKTCGCQTRQGFALTPPARTLTATIVAFLTTPYV